VLIRIFGPRRDEITGDWRKFHKEEQKGKECITHVRNAYEVFVRKPERKKSFGRPRGSWDDNIKIGHKEIGYGCMD
jgi:hypothetical protein